MDNIKEIWKDIPTFENSYQASDLGGVRSLSRFVKHPIRGTRRISGKSLRAVKSGNYLMVTISNGSIATQAQCLVHRLIAKTFIKNPENKPCVNHKNGNKSDNRAINLEWCTYSENEKHSYDVLGKKANKSNLGNLGIKSRDAIPLAMYNKNKEFIYAFGSASECKRILNGTSQGRISCAARGEQVFAYGHIFKIISRQDYYKLKKGNKKKYSFSFRCRDYSLNIRAVKDGRCTYYELTK